MEQNEPTWTFKGFSSPNFTSVPDEFFDEVAPRLSGGEVKVLLYIIRRTFGFKKERDNISLSQMLNGIVKKNGERLDFGTGMSKPSICRSLDTLEDKRIIMATKQFDFKGGCVATSYQLNMAGTHRNLVAPAKDVSAETGTPGKKMRQGGESQNLTRGEYQNLPRPLVKKRDTQYTVNNIQLDNNVNVDNKRGRRPNILHGLTDQQQDADHVRLIAADILAVLGDERSEQFYLLVARKVPESLIRKTLSELKEGGVKSPARVFTSRMMQFAREKDAASQRDALADDRNALGRRFTNG